MEIAIRIEMEGQETGYVMVGPFRDKEKESLYLEEIKAYSKLSGIQESELMELYDHIPYFTEEKYSAVSSLMTTLFEYGEIKNIISSKTSFFTNEIDPYILENLSKKLTISSIQKVFSLSEKAIYSLFKDNVDMTPKDYINLKRMEKAKKLISEGKKSLPEISSSVGFSDYSYFIKVFKKYVGTAPMKYMKKAKPLPNSMKNISSSNPNLLEV